MPFGFELTARLPGDSLLTCSRSEEIVGEGRRLESVRVSERRLKRATGID
jgi:hypothetical protein